MCDATRIVTNVEEGLTNESLANNSRTNENPGLHACELFEPGSEEMEAERKWEELGKIRCAIKLIPLQELNIALFLAKVRIQKDSFFLGGNIEILNNLKIRFAISQAPVIMNLKIRHQEKYFTIKRFIWKANTNNI